MKITFISDHKNHTNLENYVFEVNAKLDKEKCETEIINISDLNINQCIGCFSCWLKTPGKCVFNDDMDKILFSLVETDILIFSSPIVTGFISSKFKTFLDRMIPLVLPYFQFVNNEFHHTMRYEKSTKIGVILEKSIKTIDDDLKLIKEFYSRFAINFGTDLLFFTSTSDDKEVILNEISYF